MSLKARIILDRDFVLGAVDPRLFGSFVEHLGRCVYTGIYEPNHPQSDAHGFRQDVLALVRELGVTLVRYPGGNFVSGYRWEDGIGPRSARPRRRDLAWCSLETNEFGLNEFVLWCRAAGVEPMLVVNLGTRGPAEAGDLAEYCNHPSGTHWSDLRRQHGFAEPHNIRLWGLGNEMDGPWQIGRKTASEYGRLAAEAAKLINWPDPYQLRPGMKKVETVVCGSSGRGMPGFGTWEWEVLEQAFDQADYLAIHSYYGCPEGDVASFLARSEEMSDFIGECAALCDAVAAKRKASKRLMLAFDEWNVWYHSGSQDRKIDAWAVAPALLEDRYNVADALAVGNLLISLLNHADRVKIACLAQLVNVIAPICTEAGGPAWRQTIFHPFALASRFGRGVVLRQVSESSVYDCAIRKDVPYLAAAGVRQDDGLTIFAANRALQEPLGLEVEMRDFPAFELAEVWTLRHDDLFAVNTVEKPEILRPQPLAGVSLVGQRLRISLPSASWNVMRLATARR